VQKFVLKQPLTFQTVLFTMVGMRTWSIPADGPLSLRIAADVRCSQPSFVNDQIWELTTSSGDPPALALHTTFGLRAKAMRIFCGFEWDGATVFDPAQFSSPIEFQAIFPNYLRLQFRPFVDLQVVYEVWVPDSQSIGGRVTFTNLGSERRAVRLKVQSVMHPVAKGKSLTETVVSGVTVLSGKTSDIEPVVMLSGGARPEPSTFPGLTVESQLAANSSKHWTFAHAALESQFDSFQHARSVLQRNWDAEIARIELINTGLVDVETGDQDWDAALWLSQKISVGAYLSASNYLPYPSFVLMRLPDQGYSSSGDGKDHDRTWNGQTAHHAYYNALQITPAAPELAKGLIHNFLRVQTGDGRIDWKPGLAGQRNGALATPLLASLAWRIYLQTEDRSFLEDIYTDLRLFFDSWFEEQNDRDQDGVPEWDHTLQSAFDDWPAFVRWHSWGQGLDISKAETPDLIAYLYAESQALLAISEVIERNEGVERITARADGLRQALEKAWSDKSALYHHLDRDLHEPVSPSSQKKAVLGKGKGNFTVEIGRTFDPPIRVLVRSKGIEDQSHAIKVFIHGRGQKGRRRVEKLTESNFRWFWEFGTATSDRTYAEIERIEVHGVGDRFRTELRVADYGLRDQTGLLPLWAGMPDPERAEKIVHKAILDERHFWRTFGLPNCSAKDRRYAADNRDGSGGVWMFWNSMIGEGLVKYGFLDEAAELTKRLMQACIHALRQDHAFREAYNADEPSGIGDYDHIWGAAPLHLFLQVLGVRLISPHRVWVRGGHPFSDPVTIRWKGLKMICRPDEIEVIFPDGQEFQTSEPGFIEQRMINFHKQ
jgi:glycogen debranching enzyme